MNENIRIDLRKIKDRKIVCMTFDLEQDFGDILDTPRFEGLSQIDSLISLFNTLSLPLTCFVQGSLFISHPFVIQQFKQLEIEFELHSFTHPKPRGIDHEFEIAKGRETYIAYFGKEPLAYRSPCGVSNKNMFRILSEYHFKIDSSIFPSFRPGGYFNSLDKPVTPYVLDNQFTVEFPISVFSRLLRVPITLSYIKLFGKPYLRSLKSCNLPNLINFDFHLHDLANLTTYEEIPFPRYHPLYRLIFNKIYNNRNDEYRGMELLERIINMFFAKGYEFLTIADVYHLIVENT